MAKWEISARRRLIVAAVYAVVSIIWMIAGFCGNELGFVLAPCWTGLTAVWLVTGIKQMHDEAGKSQSGPVREAAAPQSAPQAPLAQGEQAAAELRRLGNAIQNPAVRARTERLEGNARKILAQLVLHPEKRPVVRQFLDYYLPTSVRVLDAYCRMESGSGPELQTLKGRIEALLENLCTAFEHQLDALLRDEVLDISADITVMEQMLAREGLSGPSTPTLEL